jgi:hypothetical protein
VGRKGESLGKQMVERDKKEKEKKEKLGRPTHT